MKVNIAKIMKPFDTASFMKCQWHSSLKNEGRKEGPQVEFAWRGESYKTAGRCRTPAEQLLFPHRPSADYGEIEVFSRPHLNVESICLLSGLK